MGLLHDMQRVYVGNKSLTRFLVVISILLLAGIPAVSAYAATLVSPTDINCVQPGDMVNIHVTGLSAGDPFTTELISTDLATSGGTVAFRNFYMPFGFDPGTSTINAVTTGISGPTTLRIVDADGTVYEGTATGSPNTIISHKDITHQQYQVHQMTGTPSGSTVGIDYTMGGTSVIPSDDPASLRFVIHDVTTGHLRILLKEGATTRLDTTLRIGPCGVTNPSGGSDSTPFEPVRTPTPLTTSAASGTYVAPSVTYVYENTPTQVTEIPVYTTETTVPAMETTTTVAKTPVAAAVPETTKTPLMPGIFVIGIIGLVGYFVAHKKV